MNNEDRKIREELIELIGCMHDADPRKERWLSWIEKQPIISPEEMLDLFKMDYSKGRYDAISKAVEWLNNNIEDCTRSYEDYDVHDVVASDYAIKKEFIEAFKKAMEQ